MLNILNKLRPFFEDNYRRIGVREFARMQGISAPSASSLLNQLNKERVLLKEELRRFHLYHANRESFIFQKLHQAYYTEKLGELLEFIEEEFLNPIIIIFGSVAKAEVSEHSDIDIAVFTPTNKSIALERFETMYKRKLHLFLFKTREELKDNRELLNNILNGFIVCGSW